MKKIIFIIGAIAQTITNANEISMSCLKKIGLKEGINFNWVNENEISLNLEYEDEDYLKECLQFEGEIVEIDKKQFVNFEKELLKNFNIENKNSSVGGRTGSLSKTGGRTSGFTN